MSIAKKEKRAIEYLKAFEPKDEPYYLCYSGGKDSDCIRILAELAGVKTDIKHNLTTVDAPETVHYVQKTIGRENIEHPELTMWQLSESVMRWWVGDDPNQMTLEDYFKNVGIDWE